jgi:hypothetical protein
VRAALVVLTHGPLRSAWCDVCNTSARYVADVYALGPSGVTRVGVFEHCPRCAENDTPDRPRGTDDAA